MIRAPYNFVPVSDEVFFPEWAKSLSQDVPFSDGVNGTITLRIIAKSPVFVRNGHTKEDKEMSTSTYRSFSKTSDGKYFIPGTSIKGAVRSVLEIMSFGKIRLDKNRKFAQREWDNDNLYDLKRKQKEFNCGWLKWDKTTGYYIENCGSPYRIAHTKLDQYFETQGAGCDLFKNKFSAGSSFNLNNEVEYNGQEYDPKTASYKYALTDGIKLKGLRFKKDADYAKKYKETRVEVSDVGFEGDIVFTGQPNQWKFPRPTTSADDNAGKFYDFVFKRKQRRDIKLLSDEEFKKYESIYSKSVDWKLWVSKITRSGMPVFFRLKEQGEICDWGLAFLYKLPYEKTPYETLPSSHRSNNYDLADCMFGTTDKENPIKGRVSFGHAFCIEQHPRIVENVRLVLSSPKASYYPTYVKQTGRNGIADAYETYNDGSISGWKRYPIRTGVWGANTGSDELDTILYPLEENTRFVSTVRFHNLKLCELGALLSALSFHGNEGCFHQLGQGKPFGYGKVEMSLDLHIHDERYKKYSKEVFMACFEHKMEDENFLIDDDSVRRLIAMSSYNVTGPEYEYMVMSNTLEQNEFHQAKEHRNYLLPFDGDQRTLALLYPEYIDKVNEMEGISKNIRDKIESEEKATEAKRMETLQELKNEASVLAQNRNYVDAIKKYEQAYSIQPEESIQEDIKNCKQKFEVLNKYNIGLDDLLAGAISSVPAFTGSLKKWMKANAYVLNDEDKQQIKEHLIAAYRQLKKGDRKKWNNKKLWDEISTLLGDDLYEIILKEK